MLPRNNMQPTSSKNNMLVVEIIVTLLLIAGGYFGYTYFFSEDSSTTEVAGNIKLGKNMSAFVQIVGKDKINLDMQSITNSAYVKSLQDHTQLFTYSSRRGRSDPFLPYDSTRPIR